MAKLPKWPKQPKKNSGLRVWENYERKVKEVATKRKAIREAPKKKDAIRNRASTIKSKG